MLWDESTGTRVVTTRLPEGRFTATLGDDPCEVAAVRAAIDAMARQAGFSDRATDFVLALDEIIANAQEHGRPPIAVDAFADGRLVVVVRDRGHGFSPRAVWSTHPPERLGQRGRGLWIARQLTDCMAIDAGADGTVVRIELSPEPHIGA